MNGKYSIGELEKVIQYTFKDKILLRQALTHSSFANEQKVYKGKDYERLEFLGDAVLELVSSDFLFRHNTDVQEGKLTKLRSSMVCEPALAYCARQIELGEYMLLGKGEVTTGGRYRDSIISDVMEAVIGAIYLDGGIEEATSYINRFILSDLEDKQLFYDSKTILQELVQKQDDGDLHYELISENGPEHDKLFKVEVMVAKVSYGTGEGHTKKAAEQQAAYEAILRLKKEEELTL